MAWKNCVINIFTSVISDQIRKEDVEELTSRITGRYTNQPSVQIAFLNRDKRERAGNTVFHDHQQNPEALKMYMLYLKANS